MPYYTNNQNQKIAYNYTKGRSPGIIFIHGLNSDMGGEKALAVEKYAKKNKLRFIRFDCRGHGKSDGIFHDFTISDWKKDLLDMIDNVAKGPQILIGSSMGGWLMFLAAKARPKRIKGLIGLAAAPDYIDSLYSSLTNKEKNNLSKKEIIKYASGSFTYLIRKKFFIDGRKNKIINKKFKLTKPLILIHGLKDKVVSKNVPEKILKKITTKNAHIIYLKNSDHRLSSINDINVIKNSIDLIRSY